jgi:RND family efflux transporter MFP subunit
MEIREQEPGAVTEQDVDIATAEMKVTAARAEIARAGLTEAQAKLARLQALKSFAMIKAPFNGTVTKRYVDSGALVIQGTDTPLLDVVRTDKFRLTFDVPETMVPHVRKGSTVGLSFDAFPGRVVEGRISRVAGVLMGSTRRMRVEVDLQNEGEMYRAGMYCNVLLRLDSIPNAFSVPAKAVSSFAGKSHVLAVQEERIRICPVSILLDDGTEVVIAGDGIEPGMPIVVSAPSMLEAGQLVKITESGAKTP